MQGQTNKILDQSYIGLKSEESANQLLSPPKRERKKNNARVLLPKLNSEQNQIQSPQKNQLSAEIESPSKQSPTKGSPTRLRRSKKIPPGYEMADYDKTIDYWKSMSYNKKYQVNNGEIQYTNYEMCDNLQDLRQYGLGIYLYLEFLKRLFIICIVLSALMLLPLYLNYNGDGLASYETQSFSFTLATFTLGNLAKADQRTYIMQGACDFIAMLILYFFYMHWRNFHNDIIENSEKDNEVLNPCMYVVSVTGFNPKTELLEENMKAYIDGLFRGSFEVEVVYNYKRNFNKFIDLEEHIEKIEKEKQLLKQTDKTNEDLLEYEKQLQQAEKEIEEIAEDFQPIYAIIHFRNLKARYAFMNMCKKYALVDSFGYNLKRCICCMPHLPERNKFLGKDELIIKSSSLARPEQYNWNNVDISSGSRFCRVILSLLIILISIVITSSLIAFCTLYVSSTSSCASFDKEMDLATAQAADSLTQYCYCSQHFSEIYTDSSIESLCGNMSNEILKANLIQSAASAVSAITNIMLIVVVSIVAQYLLKPESKPKQFSFIFVSVFISNYINSSILPLLLNGNIAGFKSVSYLGFVSFINFDNVTIFSDFDSNWYAVISPYYTTFFIFAAISPLIQLVVFMLKRRFVLWRVKKMSNNDDPDNPYIQKEVNATVVKFPLDFPTECATTTLQFFMTFMYSAFVPLALPIFTFGLLINFVCKRYIILNYTIKIPADESLNGKMISLFPLVILVHGLMGLWARTSAGVFETGAMFSVVSDSVALSGGYLARAATDVAMLAEILLILVWIIFDFTVVTCCNCLQETCKDELELPVTMAAMENMNYADRLKKTNILGSYKIINNPAFKHPYKAYRDLVKRLEKQKRAGANQMEQSSIGQ